MSNIIILLILHGFVTIFPIILLFLQIYIYNYYFEFQIVLCHFWHIIIYFEIDNSELKSFIFDY